MSEQNLVDVSAVEDMRYVIFFLFRNPNLSVQIILYFFHENLLNQKVHFNSFLFL